MNQTFSTLRRLNAAGIYVFQRVMTGQADERALDLTNPAYSQPVDGSAAFEVREFATAKEMAAEICRSFSVHSPQASAGDTGIWAWLTFALVDNLFPVSGGVRQVKELHRWFPAPPNDWQKAQRHMVRMPVLLLNAFGEDADHLICGKPNVGPEIREQLTSQQDMFSPNFQRACRKLYYDESSKSTKRGAGSSGAGSPRRLAAVRRQLDVTWDMTDLTAERILDLLPSEFDRYKNLATAF